MPSRAPTRSWSATRSRGSRFAAGDAAEVKRLFGSGRNLAGGGSLTVIATVLADGRDEGEAERAVTTTESSLDRPRPRARRRRRPPGDRRAECRVSNEDQLREPTELEARAALRSLLADLESAEAAAVLRERIEASASNAELLSSL